MSCLGPAMARPLPPLKVGDAFGRWTVVGPSDARAASHDKYVRVVCTCGKEKGVLVTGLRSGRSNSCGCLNREVLRTRSQTHGMSTDPIYAVWNSMLGRCYREGDSNFKNYGARGIKVCERWHTFENFLADMGERPTEKHSIERKDNDGDYEPGNCKWATKKEQARNTRRTRLFSFQGRSLTTAEWAAEVGIKEATLSSRLRLYGWSLKRALTTPVPSR